jgi:hypothetical protein
MELTAKEQETVKSLIKLGDTKEEAIETVLEERKRPDNSEFYRFAYTN